MMLRRCLLLLLLGGVLSREQCLSTEKCQCIESINQYEYQCPPDDPHYIIKVKQENSALIQCIKQENTLVEYMPKIYKDSFLNNLHFKMCPFPDNFVEMMNTLGVNGTKTLYFEYSNSKKNLTAHTFEGLDYLEKLLLPSNNIKRIDKDAFQHMSSLIEIDLSSNGLEFIENIFIYSNQLKYLALSDNNLKELPKDIFNNLTHLLELQLWTNKLTRLTREHFKDLTKLTSLELSSNRLDNIPYDLLYDLTNLKSISLGLNVLKNIPEHLFTYNKELEVAIFNRNPHLTDLPNDLFANLTKLGQIKMAECELKTLPEQVFEGCINLQNVSLRNNVIDKLPENVFSTTVNLQNLDLSNNKLQSLSNGLLKFTKNLKSITVENNNLVDLEESLFENTHSVETINLQNNSLRTLPNNIFQNVQELREINLAYNELRFKSSGWLSEYTLSPFSNNLKLEILNLNHNKIESIIADWKTKLYLKHLDLSYNEITYLSFNDIFMASHQIKIDLRNNQISAVDLSESENIASQQELQDAYSSNSANTVVYLDNNPLNCNCFLYDFARYFHRSINPMVPTLVTIEANNLVCASPPSMFNIVAKTLRPQILTCNLEELEIDTCPSNCVCGFRPWNKALIINCAEKNLTQAPTFTLPQENFYNQTEVYLQHNLLTECPSKSIEYENVTKLVMSYNSINDVSWIPPKLKTLHLDNNNLSYLSNDVLVFLNASTRLSELNLGNNPWMCDCDAVNFHNYLLATVAKNQKQIDIDNIKCRNGENALVQLKVNEFCLENETYIYIVGVVAALIFIILLCTTLYFWKEHEIKVWLFAHNCCLSIIAEEELDRDKKYDAFVSYSNKDEDFVLHQLKGMLENGPNPYKLCLHIRDWIPGESIPKQIVHSVEQSRRTIVVLSSNFLESIWGIMEFRTAHTQAMSEGRARVIIIIVGDVDLDGQLDEELKAYIKTNTYLKWGDPWFWNKLKYALPHKEPNGKFRKTKRSQKTENILNILNDKLALINGISVTSSPGSTPPVVNVDKKHPLSFISVDPVKPSGRLLQ